MNFTKQEDEWRDSFFTTEALESVWSVILTFHFFVGFGILLVSVTSLILSQKDVQTRYYVPYCLVPSSTLPRFNRNWGVPQEHEIQTRKCGQIFGVKYNKTSNQNILSIFESEK